MNAIVYSVLAAVAMASIKTAIAVVDDRCRRYSFMVALAVDGLVHVNNVIHRRCRFRNRM